MVWPAGESSDAPSFLNGLAREIDVFVAYLKCRHPVLVQGVVSRYAEYAEREHIKGICRTQGVALEFFVSEKYSQGASFEKVGV